MIKTKLKNKITFNIPYTKGWGCVIVNDNDWLENTTSSFQIYNTKGRIANNGIAKIVDINYNKEIFGSNLEQGNTVLINHLYARALDSMSYKVDKTSNKYGNVHVTAVVGVFENDIISFNTLKPLFDYLIMEKVDYQPSGLLLSSDTDVLIGRVLKQGTNSYNNKWERKSLKTKVGDTLLLKNGAVTSIVLDGTTYLCVRETDVIGKLNNGFNLENLELLENIVLLENCQKEKFDNSSLFVQNIDIVEEEYLSRLYDSHRFKVILSSMKNININDIIYVDTTMLESVLFNRKEYKFLKYYKGIYGKEV